MTESSVIYPLAAAEDLAVGVGHRNGEGEHETCHDPSGQQRRPRAAEPAAFEFGDFGPGIPVATLGDEGLPFDAADAEPRVAPIDRFDRDRIPLLDFSEWCGAGPRIQPDRL